jgi:hypothetical protein
VNDICSQILDPDSGKRESGRIIPAENLKEKDRVQNAQIKSLGRYLQLVENAYTLSSLKRWFSIDIELMQNMSCLMALIRASDAIRPNIDRDIIEKMEQTVVLFKSGMAFCRSVADRCLLKKIASCLGDEILYVHGELLRKNINRKNAEESTRAKGDADCTVNSG